MSKALTGKSILVVDDEEMLRELLQSVFAAEGAKVTMAENGTKAFQLCREQSFDALITDVRMPGGDGISLIKNVRAARPKTLPLFFVCSGFNDLADGTAAALGIQRVFEKPFNLREMIYEVRTLLLAAPP
jgi:DNA-binding response OmpR family regulator